MGYPDLPKNRLIVGGVDLSEKFKMILIDGYTLNPPEPKTYMVDIPGGNGSIDLTESLLGDTAYNNREQEFTFYLIDVVDFEMVKTQISNFLHGKSFDYEITMDPGYVYHGRFTISSYKHELFSGVVVGEIQIKINADPYKYRRDQVYKYQPIGGTMLYFASGRKMVHPVLESEGSFKVGFDGKILKMPPGTWSMHEITFKEGTNKIYLSSFDVRELQWGYLNTAPVTWKQFKEKPLYLWYQVNEDGEPAVKRWDSYTMMNWEDLSSMNWSDLVYLPAVSDLIKDVYIKYEWGDL